jgi:hypothetical protein
MKPKDCCQCLIRCEKWGLFGGANGCNIVFQMGLDCQSVELQRKEHQTQFACRLDINTLLI